MTLIVDANTEIDAFNTQVLRAVRFAGRFNYSLAYDLVEAGRQPVVQQALLNKVRVSYVAFLLGCCTKYGGCVGEQGTCAKGIGGNVGGRML